MRIYRHSLTWTIMFGVIALMFLRLPQMVAKQDAVVNTYSALVEVDALARQQYVDPITDDRLVEGAIRGMMLQLDPYSGYISPEEWPAFERHSRGQFFGVGIELGMQDGRLTVIAPIEGSPAAQAGVQPGDLILSIDGKDLKRRSVFDVEGKLMGAVGTQVQVVILHPGAPEPRELTLTRVSLSLQTVRGFRRTANHHWDYLIDPQHGIGYIRVSDFREMTCSDFDKAIAELNNGPLRGLILDLRFNPGGFMHQAIAMADRFLRDGLIVSTVTRRNAVDEYRAEADPSDLNIPVVVLMNSASASASEIVAGALQARKRATIVGERSFGKGSVQHLIHLVGQQAAIKLTVAYYRLPDNRIIHRNTDNIDTQVWGILPDAEITLAPDELRRVQESRRLLDTLSPEESPRALNPADPPPDDHKLEILMDRQLDAALSVIRNRIDARRAIAN